MMTLYYSPGACSLAVHIALKEAGLPVELVKVNLRAKTCGDGEDYKAINPKGSVPALRLEGGEILTEAAVILEYVADQAPAAALLPRAGTIGRYRAKEWLNFIATELHKGLAPLFKPETPEAYKSVAVQAFSQKLTYLNARLASGTYLLGDTYSVADAYLFTVLGWTALLKIDLSEWTEVLRLLSTVRARPAVLAAMEVEGLRKGQ